MWHQSLSHQVHPTTQSQGFQIISKSENSKWDRPSEIADYHQFECFIPEKDV